MIDAKHHGFVDIFTRRRDQNTLCACREMLFCAYAVGEEAGALERDIDAICGMRQIGRVAFGCDVNALAIDDDVIAIGFDCSGERAMHAIALEQ